jgi:hypothetical protein
LFYLEPIVVSVHELKHCLGLRSIRQLRVIQFSSVKCVIGGLLKTSTDGIVFKFEHARPG